MNNRVCSSCQHANSLENFFCVRCGAKLQVGNQQLPQLRLVYGEPNGALFLLRQGRTTIGHDCGNLIVLGDKLISNKHAAILYRDDAYWIEDRNSKNGVYVNGQRIRRQQKLVDSEVIKLGNTILLFEEGSASQ